MTIEKFVKNGIHYIKETLDNGAVNTYADPEFQSPDGISPPNKPPLPDLATVNQKLNFIIDELHLKDRFS